MLKIEGEISVTGGPDEALLYRANIWTTVASLIFQSRLLLVAPEQIKIFIDGQEIPRPYWLED